MLNFVFSEHPDNQLFPPESVDAQPQHRAHAIGITDLRLSTVYLQRE